VASRDDKEQPPAEPTAKAFAVGHDGKIDGIYRPHDDRRSWTATESAQLELVARAARPVAPEPQLPRRAPVSQRKKVVALAIIAAALVLPFAGRWGHQLWTEYLASQVKARGLVVIDSVPSNARLFIEGAEVGRTPYVAPNTFKPGIAVSARIVYPGAQEWNGTFPGGVDTSFTAELQAQ